MPEPSRRDTPARSRGRAPASSRSPGLRVLSLFVAGVAVLGVSALPSTVPVPGLAVAPPACTAPGSCAAPALVSPELSAPVQGRVTSCASASSCGFLFNSSGVFGGANASPPAMALRLPGEASTSSGLAYSTYTASLTGTYTYWTVGSFVGSDANTGKVVYGSTNTNFTITCIGHSGRGGGCTYKYTTDNGTIVVFFTDADRTTTNVVCAPASIASGASTTCTATVNDTANGSATPNGNVSFSGSFGGTTGFSGGGVCALVAGRCSVSYTAPDEQVGTVPIAATFNGTPSYYTSSARTSVDVSSNGSGGGGFSTVLFAESGLAAGTAWSVTFGGLSLSSTNGSVPFEVQNGTYGFTVAPQPGYVLTPSSGNVTVAGEDLTVEVRFAPVEYPVTFSETGLPAGKVWGVAWDGSVNVTDGPTLVVNATNGSHGYLLRGPAGFSVTGLAASGNLTVAGGPLAVHPTFVRGATYPLTFVAKGLPRNTTWCVVVGTLACSSTNILRFANLTPAAYAYAVLPMVGQTITAKLGSTPIPLNGTLAIATHGLRVVLRYVFPYNVTFVESGLPNSTNWTVSIAGQTHVSVNGTISFSLGNGTHAFRIGAVPGYVHSAAPTSARVLGGPVVVLVTFRT